ncbi:hypothetical protein SLA2020_500040 [Shorea laevis]
MDSTTTNSQCCPFSIRLWPPSEGSRRVLVERLRNKLTTNSIFTQKYGCLSKEEAEESAQQIEDLAFNTASQLYDRGPDGDGGAAVQLYAKECSKLLLEVLKRGPAAKNDKVLASKQATSPAETFSDISKGQRAFIEAEEAKNILRPLKEPGNSYTKICFGNRSSGLGAARVAEPILVSLKNQLKEVDLSDFIAGRGEAGALEVIKIFSAALEGSVLKSLDLSNNYALGEKGVGASGALLKSQSSLEELYLMNVGISEDAAKAVCELIPSTENLRVLKFHNNMTGDKGALAISEVVKHSPLLEDFRCSSTRVDSEGGIALSNALETCSHLKKLDLRDNVFGAEAGVGLSKSLFKHANLVGVYLSYLNLEDEGAIAVANALKESAPSLEVLEMAGNDITGDAAPALAACIASKQHLTKLNLSENELKGEGPSQIGRALEGLAQLKEVDMSNNSMRRAGARMLAQVVIEKPGFKLLNIDGNIISNEGVDEVKKYSRNFLTSLGLWMRMISKEEMTVRNLEKDKVKAKLMGMGWRLN